MGGSANKAPILPGRPSRQTQQGPESENWFLRNWKKEWLTITNAPIAFIIALAVIVFLVATAIFKYEENHYKGVIAEKDSTIEYYKSLSQNPDFLKNDASFISKLPTVEPSEAGKLWNNGGTICISMGPQAQHIKIKLAKGTDFGTIDYTSLHLASTPQSVTAVLQKTNDNDSNIFASIVTSSVTDKSARFELTAPTDTDGRILDCTIAP